MRPRKMTIFYEKYWNFSSNYIKRKLGKLVLLIISACFILRNSNTYLRSEKLTQSIEQIFSIFKIKSLTALNLS